MTAGSAACAANGAAARASVRKRAGRLIMVGIPVNAFALIYGRSRLRASHILTRWRERDVFAFPSLSRPGMTVLLEDQGPFRRILAGCYDAGFEPRGSR